MKRPVPPLRGRGGSLIVVDESQAPRLSEALTGPMPEVVETPDWSDRFNDRITSNRTFMIAGAFVGLLVLAMVIGGVFR